MTIILNYLPWFILFIGTFVAVKPYFTKEDFDADKDGKRSAGVILGTFAVFLGLLFAGPSYMPKGTVAPLKNPGFEVSESEIKDNLRKPNMTDEERQKRFDEKFDAVKQATQ